MRLLSDLPGFPGEYLPASTPLDGEQPKIFLQGLLGPEVKHSIIIISLSHTAISQGCYPTLQMRVLRLRSY
jgi:hypothetical protein